MEEVHHINKIVSATERSQKYRSVANVFVTVAHNAEGALVGVMHG
jgi:hypothetical protein